MLGMLRFMRHAGLSVPIVARPERSAGRVVDIVAASPRVEVQTLQREVSVASQVSATSQFASAVRHFRQLVPVGGSRPSLEVSEFIKAFSASVDLIACDPSVRASLSDSVARMSLRDLSPDLATQAVSLFVKVAEKQLKVATTVHVKFSVMLSYSAEIILRQLTIRKGNISPESYEAVQSVLDRALAGLCTHLSKKRVKASFRDLANSAYLLGGAVGVKSLLMHDSPAMTLIPTVLVDDLPRHLIRAIESRPDLGMSSNDLVQVLSGFASSGVRPVELLSRIENSLPAVLPRLDSAGLSGTITAFGKLRWRVNNHAVAETLLHHIGLQSRCMNSQSVHNTLLSLPFVIRRALPARKTSTTDSADEANSISVFNENVVNLSSTADLLLYKLISFNSFFQACTLKQAASLLFSWALCSRTRLRALRQSDANLRAKTTTALVSSLSSDVFPRFQTNIDESFDFNSLLQLYTSLSLSRRVPPTHPLWSMGVQFFKSEHCPPETLECMENIVSDLKFDSG